MSRTHRQRQAPHRSACFALSIGIFFCATATSAADPACSRPQVANRATVAYVYDGDTVRLTDGRKLRLIGVNTPERAHGDQSGQPLSEPAYRFVQQLLSNKPNISLYYDAERHDRHGRILAHVFLADGRNLSRLLLREGHALALTVPPNLALLACYQAAEKEARTAQRGVWTHPYFAPLTPAQLTERDRGFRRVGGRITGYSQHRGNLWLKLSSELSLFIRKSDRAYFQEPDPAVWVGRDVVARGWLRRHRGRWQMTIRHPVALENPTQNGR